MTGFLSVVAVVAFMASAGLPWWVVAVVALLTAGFAGGRCWSPGRGARSTPASGPAGQSVWSAADRRSAVRPVSANVPAARPDEYAHEAPGGGRRWYGTDEERARSQPAVADPQCDPDPRADQLPVASTTRRAMIP